MPKTYKPNRKNETKCKDLHKKMNMQGNPTRMVQPNLFMIVDIDDMQKQTNAIENKVAKIQRIVARYKWRRALRNGNH